MRTRWGMFVATLALLAGCGGGDSDALSVDDYRSQLDAECARVNEELAVLTEEKSDDLSEEELQEQALEIGDGFEERVRAMTPPDELGDAHDALVEAFDDPIPDGRDLDAWRAYVEDSLRLYEDLGAEGCQEEQQKALDSLPDD